MGIDRLTGQQFLGDSKLGRRIVFWLKPLGIQKNQMAKIAKFLMVKPALNIFIT